MAPGLPTCEEIEAWVIALVTGGRSRDEADGGRRSRSTTSTPPRSATRLSGGPLVFSTASICLSTATAPSRTTTNRYATGSRSSADVVALHRWRLLRQHQTPWSRHDRMPSDGSGAEQIGDRGRIAG